MLKEALKKFVSLIIYPCFFFFFFFFFYLFILLIFKGNYIFPLKIVNRLFFLFSAILRYQVDFNILEVREDGYDEDFDLEDY